MARIQQTIEVAKETYELSQGVSKFLKSVKVALSNGWQLGEDMPVIVTSALGELLPSLEGVEKISEERQLDGAAFYRGVALGLTELVEIFTEDAPAATPAAAPKPPKA